MPGTMNEVTRRARVGLSRFAAVLLVFTLLPAWSLRCWQAWVYVALFMGTSAALTLYRLRHDPALLKRRLSVGPGAETDPRQRVIQSVARLAFLGLLVVPGFDSRFGWSAVPLSLVILGEFLLVAGLGIVFL